MDWKSILVSVLLSLIPAVVVAFITVRLSLRQFYSQKWWEKKAESYSKIIGSLANLFYSIKELCSEAEGEKEIGNKNYKKLINNYPQYYEIIKKASSAGAFIISKKVSIELDALVDNLENNYFNRQKESIADLYGRDFNFIKNSLEIIRILAKKDLRISWKEA